MSGEVSLRGNILPVDGIKEKLSAARRVGIKKIILPKANQKNIADLPAELIEGLDFLWVEKMDEVFEKALIGFNEQKRLHQVVEREVTKLDKKRKKRKKKKRKIGG